MNDKDLNLDVFENADDDTIKKIAADCPASDEEKERMFAMSRKIYKERTNESNDTDSIQVSGVERYKKSIWQKIVAAAAVLALTAGAVTGGALMLKRSGHVDPAVASKTEIKVSPFGDLSGHEVRMMTSAIAPAVFVPKEELRTAMLSSFNEGEWTETDKDTPIPDGGTVQVFLRKDDDIFKFVLYSDGTIFYSNGEDHSRWQVSKDIINSIYAASEFDMESGDILLYTSDPYDDLLHNVWEATTDVPQSTENDFIEIYNPILGTESKAILSSCYFSIVEKTKDKNEYIDLYYAQSSSSVIKEMIGMLNGFEWTEEEREADYILPEQKIAFGCQYVNNDSLQIDIWEQGEALIYYFDFEKGTSMHYIIGQENAKKLFDILYDDYKTTDENFSPDKLIKLHEPSSYILNRLTSNGMPADRIDITLDDTMSEKIKTMLMNGKYTETEDNSDTENGDDTSEKVGYNICLVYDDNDIYSILLYDNNELLCDYRGITKCYKISGELYNELYSAVSQQFENYSPPSVKIPPCRYMQKELAKNQLNDLGLSVDIRMENDNSVAPNYVIRTEPDEGSEIPQGSTVIMYVNSGDSQPATTDKYVGMTADDAVLKANFIGIDIITEYVPSSEHEGLVVGQEPEPGTELASGSSLKLYVSSGNPSD